MRLPGLRAMLEGDVLAADALRQLAGWNQTVEHWRLLLALAPGGCFVAEEHGQIVGTLTTTVYAPALAWIGMMLIHPAHRRQGLGSELMRRALEHLHSAGVGCVKLDATPLGRPVYERLGFLAERALTRWRRPPTGSTALAPGSCGKTRPLVETDWPVVETLDARALGTARPRLLRLLAAGSRRVLACSSDRLEGFGMLRPGDQADHLGPLVGRRSETAAALLPALLVSAENRAVVWDLPDDHDAALELARRHGFAPARLFTRMYLGQRPVVDEPLAQFSIADPSLG